MRKIALSQDMAFPILDVLLNGLNFFMHIFLSWYISLNDYSVLNASLSFLAILFIFGISIQTYTTKEIGRNPLNKEISTNVFSLLMLITLSMNLLILVTSPWLISLLRISKLILGLIVLIFDANLLLSYLRGYLQGHKQFLNLNISFYIEVMTKLAIIVIILPYRVNVVVPLIGILLGMIASMVHSIFLLRGHHVFYVKKPTLNSDKLKRLIHFVGSNFFLYYLTSITLIESNYFIGERAAIYAVSLKFSQLILAVGFSVITVLNAYGSELVNDPPAFAKYFRKWLLRFIIGGILILVCDFVIVREVISLLFGKAYSSARDYVVLQGAAYVMLTIGYLLISMLLLLEKHFHLYILSIISVLLTVGVYLNHTNIRSVILVEVIVFTSLSIVLALAMFIKGEFHVNKS